MKIYADFYNLLNCAYLLESHTYKKNGHFHSKYLQLKSKFLKVLYQPKKSQMSCYKIQVVLAIVYLASSSSK